MTIANSHTRRSRLCMAGLCTALLSLGCELIPPNNFRLITAEPAGSYPSLIHFDNGTFWQDAEAGVAMIASRDAVVLFDCRGATNRFDLSLTNDRDQAFYQRIGEYGPLRNRHGTFRPIGIRSWTEGGQLRGVVDVFVARSEERDVGTSFEHYPRTMRVVGYFVLPKADADQTEHLLASLVKASPSDAPTGFPNLHEMESVTGPSRLSPIVARLPPLPIIDVRYLLPDAFLASFRPRIP